MVQEYRFLVKGTAPDPYEVWIRKRGANLTASCTCPAGRNLMHCKHRLNLLRGLEQDVVGGDVDRISSLPELLAGTDVEQVLQDLSEAEFDYETAKKRVSAEKKRLAMALMD